MSPAAAAGRRRRRAPWRVAVAVLLAACVTTVEEAPPLEFNAPPPPIEAPPSLTIPFGENVAGAQQQLVDEFYRSVLRQLQEAATSRDPATGRHDVDQLGALLARFERDDMPPGVRERVAGYRRIERGLRFAEGHAARAARVELLPAAPAADGAPVPVEQGAPALGAPLRFELRLPAGPEPAGLGGVDDDEPAGFLVHATIDDAFVEGSVRTFSRSDVVRLPDAFALADGTELRLPIAVDEPVGEAVRRVVTVRVSLLPGYVRLGGALAPVPQTLLAEAKVAQWPAGFGALQKAPLAELQAALRVFEPRAFPRAWLAAVAAAGAPAADRESAIALLLEPVRFGRADQAQVAMAALRELTGERLLVGDRDAWLAWSQSRR